MKYNRKIIYFSLVMIIGCILCSCTKQRDNETQTHINEKKENEQIVSEIIQDPEALNSAEITGSFVVNTEDMPIVINMVDDKKENRVHYEVNYLNEDGTWKTTKPKWNDYFNKNHTYGMIGIVEDTKDRFYALIGNGKCTNQKVVRLYEDGNVEEINIDDIKKVTDGEMPIGISMVNDNQVLIQYIGDQSTTHGGIHGIVFDLLEKKIVGTHEVISTTTCQFDANGMFYRADTLQNLIIGKKMGEDLASCSIKCEGTLSASSPIVIKDDYGYVLTDGGIYGGKLTDKSWGCILPKDKMESGYVQNFIKTSGHDAEFYCFQMKDKNEFQWIHYY